MSDKKKSLHLLKDNHEFLSFQQESRRYKEQKDPDELCLSVADSDVQFADIIKQYLHKVINNGDLSYAFFDQKMLKAVNKWFHNHHQREFEEEQVIFGSSVVQLIQVALDAICKKSEQVVVMTPAYPPFLHIVPDKELELLINPLVQNEDGSYEIDFALLEKQFSDPKTKAIIFCSPHNPVNRIWSKAELVKIIALAKKYEVFIISDEIWSEVVYNQGEHHIFLDVDPSFKDVILIHAPSKSFNLGGLMVAYAMTYNEEFMEKMHKSLEASFHYSSSNYLSCHMLIAAYKYPEAYMWHDEYCSFLERNYNYIAQALKAETDIIICPSQATNLIWLNFKNYHLNEEQLEDKLAAIKIKGAMGSIFGISEEEAYVRMVIGLNIEYIQQLVARLIKAFKTK